MNKKAITPNPKQPVDRVPTGQLPTALAELSEDALVGGSAHVQVSLAGMPRILPPAVPWMFL